jgi:hypothetical protein
MQSSLMRRDAMLYSHTTERRQTGHGRETLAGFEGASCCYGMAGPSAPAS